MTPDVEVYVGSLWGVLTVRTYGELNDRELAAVMEEWKAMADSGWGEELFYRPIRTEKGEIYIGFWDTDNNDNLFIKTYLLRMLKNGEFLDVSWEKEYL